MRRLTGFRWGVIYPLAAGPIDWLLRIMMLALLAPPVAAAADVRGVADEPCPPSAIAVEPGASIQAAVDRAGVYPPSRIFSKIGGEQASSNPVAGIRCDRERDDRQYGLQ